jgi:dipeptidyl-peptidase-4
LIKFSDWESNVKKLWVAAAMSCVGWVCAMGEAVATSAVVPELSLDRIYSDPPLAGRMPRGAMLSPGGSWVTYLRPSNADSEVIELWGQPLPEGEPRSLVTVSDLIGQRTAVLTEAEKMALERRRVRGSGILGYTWCGSTDQRLIIPLSGDLYLVEWVDGAVQSRRLTTDEGAPEREPRCDAAGTQVAYVKQGDLWVQSLKAGPARRLTRTGSATRSTGLAEFIAAEELDRHQGFWWSPDGRRILALEVDESGVPIKTRAQIFDDRTAMTEQRYPAAGENNARVKPLLIEVATAKAQALNLPAEAEYIARAGWFADGVPWLQWLTRDQKRLVLLEFDPVSARSRVILDERDDAWVELHDDLREMPDQPLSGKPGLLWSSERSGRRQLWSIDRVSGAARPLTDQPEAVARALCVSGNRLVFTGATERGRGREVFELDLSPERSAESARERTRVLQPGDSRRWRDASADSRCERLIVSESRWGVPASSSIWSLTGTSDAQADQARIVPLRAEPPDPLLSRITPQIQVLELLAADGRTPLNAFYLPPLVTGKALGTPGTSAGSGSRAGNAPPAQAPKHPVIVRAYGGPTTATVRYAYDSETPLMAIWQRLGFGILLVDTRGMAYRDRAFTRMHERAFGRVEVQDLFAAVRQLPKLVSTVDEARIGFTGWSYGGYLAARAMLDLETPFAAAVAGAPPTDWTLYDTAYTERYLGMPDGGRALPYVQSNLLSRARLLERPLMLIHGTADDNVLFENTLRLVSALQHEGKLFETVVYPGQAHGITGSKRRFHLARTQTDFFLRHLRPGPMVAPVSP